LSNIGGGLSSDLTVRCNMRRPKNIRTLFIRVCDRPVGATLQELKSVMIY
jgi:hypothetical protein